jgi:ATP-binding protein involved in chromosome partitioning
MTVCDPESVRSALGNFSDPETGKPLSETGQIINVQVSGQTIMAEIGLTSHSAPLRDEVREQMQSRLQGRFPGCSVEITFTEHHRPAARLGQIALRVKSVIAVGSGKGGVGKSTVAASLALTLQSLGCRVGLMDADVYGPSIPHLLGLTGRPEVNEEKKIVPIRFGTMPVISMGFLIPPDQAVIWRGPMLHGSITQFLRDTDWGELDYLIIDMPPGTGDVALTLSQSLPLAGAVVVCTPQDVALLDAVKAISMFRKVEIPILGMVENMSGFTCPDCGKSHDIFGRGGARAKAEEVDIPFLGALPINLALRIEGDNGRLDQALLDVNVRPAIESMARAVVRSLAMRTAGKPKRASLPTL